MRDEFKNARLGLPQKPRRNIASSAQSLSIYEDAPSAPAGQQGARLMGGGAIKARRPQKIKLDTVREDRSISSSVAGRKSSIFNAPSPTIREGRCSTDGNPTHGESTTNPHATIHNRRRTIWLPSDDTTVLSIHPGSYDQTLRDDTICLPPQRPLATKTTRQDVLNTISTCKRPHMSVAPKRAPLRTLAPVRPNAVLQDNVKCLNGKENIPPGAAIITGKSEVVPGKDDGARLAKVVPQPSNKIVPATRTQILREQKAALHAKAHPLKKRSVPEPKEDSTKIKKPLTKDPRLRVSSESSSSVKLREHIANTRSALHNQATSKGTDPIVQSRADPNLSRYPVLADDLVQPELYEDNWLTHQEVTLTQLINSVFQKADATSSLPHDEPSKMRNKLLRLYQAPTTVNLYKRTKASLMYGALSMPKDTKDLPRLRGDVGLRRQFLDLWVQSYDLDALRAAAEVIIGRALVAKPRDAASVAQALGSSSVVSGSAKERELRRFLLAFLVHHEDATDAPRLSHGQDTNEQRILRVGTPEWYWHRTVLHSLMLIHLLDEAKVSSKVSGCLFQASSIRKSSNSVLHALTRMLVPWVGDVTRPLGHLEYSVSYLQLPLSEYTYRIDNIATDLRNGVLLTRFVELMIYPSSDLQTGEDQTLTLSLPDGETLTSTFSGSDADDNHVLSQHLKFPCAGRAQKLHNVQIALSALRDVEGSLTEAAVSSTRAEDVVDGHREKTLSLLWSLVSKWAMGMLVDWDELKHETRRFAVDNSAFDARLYLDDTANQESMSAIPDAHEQSQLLKAWVSAICEPHSIPINNLTTSFASGDALSCLVAAYSKYLPTTLSSKTPIRNSISKPSANSTADALRALGCSEAFTTLFATRTVLPARSTTIALLAFLASRLLPLARSHRAARTIQSAWRVILARRTITKRVNCMRLAHDCATIVKLKNEYEDAAVVFQGRWRGVLESRRQKAYRDAVELQRLARGWAVRKALRGVLSFGSRGPGGSVVAGGRRVMGGW
ncbi:hypothetical protein AAFC00_006578 [Neodothiora populina]